jgi:hypothetical protein
MTTITNRFGSALQQIALYFPIGWGNAPKRYLGSPYWYYAQNLPAGWALLLLAGLMERQV